MKQLLIALACANACMAAGYLFPIKIHGECFCAERPPFVMAPFTLRYAPAHKAPEAQTDERPTQRYDE